MFFFSKEKAITLLGTQDLNKNEQYSLAVMIKQHVHLITKQNYIQWESSQ